MNSKTLIVGIIQLFVLLLLFDRFSIQALAQVAETDWPMFGHDLRHTWRSPYNGPQQPKLKWEFINPDKRWWPPGKSLALGEDGTIYVGAADSAMYAINPNGTLRWKFHTGGEVWSTPAIAKDGTIYVGADDSSLYAINPHGTLQWRFRTERKHVSSSPAIGADGTIYVGSGSFFYAIRPDGTLKWKEFNWDAVESSPAIAKDGTIYFCSEDESNALKAMNPDGTKKWSRGISGWGITYSSPAIADDGTIYIGSTDHRLYALDPAKGETKWTFTTNDEIHSSPAIGPDGTIYISSRKTTLYAVTPQGQQKWTFGRGLSYHGVTIGQDGTVYVSAGIALTPDGKVKWQDFHFGSGWPSVIGKDGTLYGISSLIVAVTEQTVSVSENTTDVSNSYLLSQNYPNPFNPVTTISFTVPKVSHVTLKIFNLLGEHVTTLVEQEFVPGRYQVEWNAGDMKGGTYLYQLQAGDFREIKKLVLLK